jgi:hypothetical protein
MPPILNRVEEKPRPHSPAAGGFVAWAGREVAVSVHGNTTEPRRGVADPEEVGELKWVAAAGVGFAEQLQTGEDAASR